jgi:hypothetical protein
MDRSPAGEGGQSLIRMGSLLANQEIAGRDDRAVGTGAEAARDELGQTSYRSQIKLHA